jgi:uncharacterized OsmC-like protein
MQVATSKQKIVNGVNVDLLYGTIDTIKDKPELARFKLRAINEWIDGAHVRTTIKDFYGAGKEDKSRSKPFVLEGDEPAVLLGEDHGPNATEAALHALASCLNTTFVYYAAAQGIKLEELEFQLEGDLDLQGFLGIAPHKVKADAPKEKLEELCRLAQMRSPVFDIVTNSVPVSIKLETR